MGAATATFRVEQEESRASALAVGLLGALPVSFLMLRAGTLAPADPDSWWLAAAGRWTLEHGRPPTANLFSFAVPDQAWVNHEWGLSLLYALGLEHAGPLFLVWVALASVWCVSAIVGFALVRDAASHRGILALLGILCFGFGPYLAVSRPNAVTLIYLAAMGALAFGRHFGRGSLAASVGLAWLWANTHGNFPLGLGLLAAGAIGMPEGRRRRAVALVAATLVTFANPYGAALHGLSIGYATGSGAAPEWIARTIREFQPVWAEGGVTLALPTRVALALLLGLALRALVVGQRRMAALAFLTLVALGLPTARYLWSAGIVGCVLLVPVGEAVPMSRLAQGDRRTILATLLLVPAIVGIGGHVWFASQRTDEAWWAPELGGPQLSRLVAEIPDGANVLAPASVSSRVLWQGAPRGVRVLFDLRNDCYPWQVAKSQIALDHAELSPARAREELDAWPASHALVDVSLPLARHLRELPDWEKVETVPGWELWRRVPDGYST